MLCNFEMSQNNNNLFLLDPVKHHETLKCAYCFPKTTISSSLQGLFSNFHHHVVNICYLLSRHLHPGVISDRTIRKTLAGSPPAAPTYFMGTIGGTPSTFFWAEAAQESETMSERARERRVLFCSMTRAHCPHYFTVVKLQKLHWSHHGTETYASIFILVTAAL